MPRAKKYKSEDGCYLTITERVGHFYLVWYIPDDEDFGGYVGESEIYQASEAPKSKDEWEIWTADNQAKRFAEGRDGTGFYFNTATKAKLALAAANEVLLTGAPWPDWALKAKEAGWTPPKGWKP